jgi:uncharacterized repeat protein (TIGR03847 family)
MSVRDLGTATTLGADAVGQPGQRRFRLFARTRAYSAILWMEKEQLLNLSLVIDRILAQVSEGRILRTEAQAGGLPSAGGEMPDDFPISPDFDLQVGQLRLSFEGDQDLFTLVAVPFEITEDEQGEPRLYLHSDEALSIFFSIEQAQRLASRITALVNAGRPVCPLCHAPLDGGPHACIKQNGHREIIQLLEEEEDDEEEE